MNASVVSVGTTAAPHSTFSAGQTVAILVNFSQPVTVNTSSSAAYLQLNLYYFPTNPFLPATLEQASYVSGSGTSTLVFNYTVQNLDQPIPHLDYPATYSLVGNINDVSDSLAADIVLPAPGSANDGLAAAQLTINPNLISPSPIPPPGNPLQQLLTFEESMWNQIMQITQQILQAAYHDVEQWIQNADSILSRLETAVLNGLQTTLPLDPISSA